MLTIVMLVVDTVLWTAIMIYNRMVTIFSREELHYDELILEGRVIGSGDEIQCNEK